MIQHKLLNPGECQIYNEDGPFIKYVLRFEKTTEYFKSKCRYYFNIKPIVFEYVEGENVDVMEFDELLKHDLVEFQITYNKREERIDIISLFVKNNGNKGKKFYQLEMVDLMSL